MLLEANKNDEQKVKFGAEIMSPELPFELTNLVTKKAKTKPKNLKIFKKDETAN